MVYLFKTHPFNMTFAEIRAMTFKQSLILMEEYQRDIEEKAKMAAHIAGKTKDVMAVFDLTRGVYG